MQHPSKFNALLTIFLCLTLQLLSCKTVEINPVVTGAERMNEYLHLLKDKKVALVVNHTSMINQAHLIDTLLSLNINIKAIFSPEHGLRGKEDAGAIIEDGKDSKTGLPVYSLHGSTRKPLPEQLANIDIVIFDMQDVGVRFYTYISTMHYIMESCAENQIPLLILDRPNPLGFYVDGPVLEKDFKSFVGMHPIPVVHGLTVGELARMINGEGWLDHQQSCSLNVVPCKNWDHKTKYKLPIKPSPNLPNQQAILLYPSLCFFEATDVSIGRGTYFPFQAVGYPVESFGDFAFTPVSIPGMAVHPKHEGVKCYGKDLSTLKDIPNFTLSYLIDAKKNIPKGKTLITRSNWFNLLAGNRSLQQQISDEMSENQIRQSWQEDLERYKIKRKKYILYPDFE